MNSFRINNEDNYFTDEQLNYYSNIHSHKNFDDISKNKLNFEK